MQVIDLMREGETRESNFKKLYDFLNSDKIKTKYFDSVEWDGDDEKSTNKFTIKVNGLNFLKFSQESIQNAITPRIYFYCADGKQIYWGNSSSCYWGRIYNCSGGIFFSMYESGTTTKGYKIPCFCIVKDKKNNTSIVAVDPGSSLASMGSTGMSEYGVKIIALNTKSTSTSLVINIIPDKENTTAITTFSPIVVNDDDTTIDKAYALITAQSRQQTTFLLNGKNYYSNGAWAVEDADQDTE